MTSFAFRIYTIGIMIAFTSVAAKTIHTKNTRRVLMQENLDDKKKNTISAVDTTITEDTDTVYVVRKAKKPLQIDGNWDKPVWRSVPFVEISNFLGKTPSFRPKVQAKMMYDRKNVYVIFKVNDCYVRNVVDEYNGPVSEDACVELFFAPDTQQSQRYFNLEINAGGTPKMAYHTFQQDEYQKVAIDDLKQIVIAHSLPKKVDPEIETPISWTIEYKLPLTVLEKYGAIIAPKHGAIWKANFYKTSSKSSNPHWMTWTVIGDVQTKVKFGRFHQPKYFGQLKFE